MESITLGTLGSQKNQNSPDRKNLFILSEVFYPDEVSTAYILSHIAIKLAANYNINVICGPVGYHKQFSAKAESLENIKVNRVRLFHLNKNSYWQRSVRLVLLSIIMSGKLFFKAKRGEKVFIVTNPAPMLVAVGLISGFKKLHLSILVHDVFPENLAAANILNKNSLLFRFLSKIFNSSYQKADNIIVLGKDMKQVFEDKLKQNTELEKVPVIAVIENWADVVNIVPFTKKNNKIINNLGIENKLVLQFAGNLGRLQGLQNLIKWIKDCDNNRIHYIFIGEGALKPFLIDFIRGNKIKNVSIIDGMPRSEQSEFLNACDIGIVSLVENMKGLGVPSKAYNLMAAGKPLLYIGDGESEIALLINEFKNGWIVKPNDFNSFKNIINEILETSPEKLRTMGTVSRELAEKKFAMDKILTKFSDLID